MKIVSFDQSTRCSGYAIFEDGQYVTSGVIDMSKSQLDTDERSFEMAKSLWRVLKQYKPEHLIIENVQQQTSPKVLVVLARLQGMIIGYAEAHKIKVHILLPSQWRATLKYNQGAKVKRAELKQQSADYVKNKYGFVKSEDENEAIALNDAARIKLGLDVDWA